MDLASWAEGYIDGLEQGHREGYDNGFVAALFPSPPRSRIPYIPPRKSRLDALLKNLEDPLSKE